MDQKQEREEEEEEVVVHLTSTNPQAPSGHPVKWDLASGAFQAVPWPRPSAVICHLELQSSVVARDSEEARQQLARVDQSRGSRFSQFAFTERGTQTLRPFLWESGVQTSDPPLESFSASVSRAAVHDHFQVEQGQEDGVEVEVEVEARMAYSAKVLERMVSQSHHWEVALDFRYWEDPADSYRCHRRTEGHTPYIQGQGGKPPASLDTARAAVPEKPRGGLAHNVLQALHALKALQAHHSLQIIHYLRCLPPGDMSLLEPSPQGPPGCRPGQLQLLQPWPRSLLPPGNLQPS